MSALQSDCPIAREKLIPYLSGNLDGTPEGEEFEVHVNNCPVCKAIASDRRKTLQALIAALDPASTKHNVFEGERGTTRDKSVKLLLLAGVCALLLIGMSYVSGPVSAILGDRVAIDGKSETSNANDNSPIAQPKTTRGNIPLGEESKESVATASSTDSSEGQKGIEGSKKPQSVPNGKRTVGIPNRSAKTSSPTKKRSEVPRSSPPMNRIEVFDESGKKIGVAITPQGR